MYMVHGGNINIAATNGYIATNGNLVLCHSSGTINQAFINVTYVI